MQAESVPSVVQTPIREQADESGVSVSSSSIYDYKNAQNSQLFPLCQDFHNGAERNSQSDATSVCNLVSHGLYPDSVDEHLFDLNMTSVAFLDEVFAVGLPESERQDLSMHRATSNESPFQDPSGQLDVSSQSSRVESSFTRSDKGLRNEPYSCHVDGHTLEAAICAYFKYQAPVLPLLSGEAFWNDYRRGVSSDSLVLALACRGFPFLELSDKWHLQQLVAGEFRRAILQTHENSSVAAPSRVDELEAFALMVDFRYDESAPNLLESRLSQLFLSFDSLVLSTLHLEHDHPRDRTEQPLTDLTLVQDRRIMLFWHVYGLDAFHCLDKLKISRIRDAIAGPEVKPGETSTQGYLDAILQLASIARKIVECLDDYRIRRTVLDRERLVGLYELLRSWRSASKPPHLAWPLGFTSPQDNNKNCDGEYTRLHSFVLAILELNCYMQIERHSVSSEEPRNQLTDLVQDALQLRIKLESLEAIQRTFCNHDWQTLLAEIEQGSIHPSLIDRYPCLLRDVCAGVYVWLSSKSDVKSRHSVVAEHTSLEGSGNRGVAETYTKHPANLNDVHELLRGLKIAIASARSHHDTASLLSSLN